MSSKKREDKIRYYEPNPEAQDTSNGELIQLLSFCLGFLGVILKAKYLLWMGLIMLLSCFFNMKNNGDYKQLILNSGIIIMGMVNLYYLGPKMIMDQESALLQQKLETQVKNEDGEI